MENKITISRSYGRKLSNGNFGSNDFSAYYSKDIPIDTSLEKQLEISTELYSLCVADVENAIADFQTRQEGGGLPMERFLQVINGMTQKQDIMTVVDYETMNSWQKNLTQALKRAFKRSDTYKESLIKRSE